MAKALKIGALVAGVAALTIVTGGAALGLAAGASITGGIGAMTSMVGLAGLSVSTLLTASAVLGAGASLLSPKPKAPGGLSSTSDRLTVSINVREPRKIALGSTAFATDLRDQEWSNDQTYLHRFIVVASHRVQAIREIWLDDKLAWTAAGGAQGEFAPWLQVTPVLEGSAANAINLGARMGSARRYTGCAYVYLRFQILANSKKLDSVFNQTVPSRVTIVGDGAPVYDPRLDSTVPGGSGPMRASDQTTWVWNAGASRNPALGMLFYLLGWRINGRLAVGKGIPGARIDLASFITAANLCDEPVAKSSGGTEPRYRCDGVLSEADDTTVVLDNLKACMNAVLDDVDGRLRVSVLHNDLSAPIGELSTGDVLGTFTWQQTLPLNDGVSVIRGGYIDSSSTSLFQMADYPEVAIGSADGIERSQTVNYPLVQSASQAQRLSKQRLQRMLYGGTFTAVFQATAWAFQKGDVIRFTFVPLGWDRKLFRIADMATQVDGKVPLMLREEAPAIYAWDGSDAAPVQAAAPTIYDASLWPLVQGIVDAGTTAEWDKVADPTNTKPHNNATVGAPGDTPVGGVVNPDGTVSGGRPASQIVSDLDLNGRNVFDLAQTTTVRDGLMLARTTLLGKPIGTVVATFQAEQQTTNQAIAENFSLLGAKVDNGQSWWLDGATVKVGPDGASAVALSTLVATIGAHTASIADVKEVLVGPDGVSARAVLALNVDGKLAGMVSTNTGVVSRLEMAFDSYSLLGPNGSPLIYAAGDTVTMPNVVVDTLKANSVETVNLRAGSVTNLTTSSFPDVAIGAGETTILEATGIALGDEVDGRGLALITFMQDGTASIDTAIIVRVYVKMGATWDLFSVDVTPSGIRVTGTGDARWGLRQTLQVPLMAAGAVGIRVTAQGAQIAGGGNTTGSNARGIIMTIFSGAR